ncbi:metallophosphoesterase family protein [Bradyrhizobium betae]|uniref:DNA repair exonuclease n=1 Tax=Bradyrhizobium betae TaxID=244734 RepID=A0A5P6P6N9_9BRAD|nr:DNA repair exonuclease [Bradyrhizobium betae]MCS3731355.1 DNA repair exonuclease SbcCD nuclease subunit [Bradyrhizobium betae]QFI73950.1 DNA repair exonuclease [Bradyrhizobium betae]
MPSFRFLHTGDIHLDSPLKGLAGQEGPAAELIRTATRQALANLVDAALKEEVSFVIIAGDLYDGDWRDYQTGLYFVRQMGRLAAAQIPVYLIYGNHDAESQITRRLTLPENVKVFSSRKAQTFTIDDLGVALHGQSFKQRDVSDNLVPAYPQPLPGLFNIGLLHTGLGGMSGHLNYAPCSMDELVNKGYDYWALAHVHQAAILHREPYVVFCGNLQGRHIRETGPKGASLVSVRDGQIEDIASIHADVVRWALIRVSAEGSHHASDLVDRIRAVIVHAVENDAEGRLLACRIELTGKTELHGPLLSSVERITAEARSSALSLGEEAAWIERIVIKTEPVGNSAGALRADALGDLQRIIEQASADSQLVEQMETAIGELVRKLPHELRVELEDGALKDVSDGNYKSLMDRIGNDLTTRLAAEGM